MTEEKKEALYIALGEFFSDGVTPENWEDVSIEALYNFEFPASVSEVQEYSDLEVGFIVNSVNSLAERIEQSLLKANNTKSQDTEGYTRLEYYIADKYSNLELAELIINSGDDYKAFAGEYIGLKADDDIELIELFNKLDKDEVLTRLGDYFDKSENLPKKVYYNAWFQGLSPENVEKLEKEAENELLVQVEKSLFNCIQREPDAEVDDSWIKDNPKASSELKKHLELESLEGEFGTKISEYSFLFNKNGGLRLMDDAIADAKDAFFNTLASAYTEIETGDISPMYDEEFDRAVRKVSEHWIVENSNVAELVRERAEKGDSVKNIAREVRFCYGDKGSYNDTDCLIQNFREETNYKTEDIVAGLLQSGFSADSILWGYYYNDTTDNTTMMPKVISAIVNKGTDPSTIANSLLDSLTDDYANNINEIVYYFSSHEGGLGMNAHDLIELLGKDRNVPKENVIEGLMGAGFSGKDIIRAYYSHDDYDPVTTMPKVMNRLSELGSDPKDLARNLIEICSKDTYLKNAVFSFSDREGLNLSGRDIIQVMDEANLPKETIRESLRPAFNSEEIAELIDAHQEKSRAIKGEYFFGEQNQYEINFDKEDNITSIEFYFKGEGGEKAHQANLPLDKDSKGLQTFIKFMAKIGSSDLSDEQQEKFFSAVKKQGLVKIDQGITR